MGQARPNRTLAVSALKSQICSGTFPFSSLVIIMIDIMMWVVREVVIVGVRWTKSGDSIKTKERNLNLNYLN